MEEAGLRRNIIKVGMKNGLHRDRLRKSLLRLPQPRPRDASSDVLAGSMCSSNGRANVISHNDCHEGVVEERWFEYLSNYMEYMQCFPDLKSQLFQDARMRENYMVHVYRSNLEGLIH